MEIIKKRIEKIQNPKIKALFYPIKPIELVLMLLPFLVSLSSTKGISQSIFYFTFMGLSLSLMFLVFYIIKLNCRIIFFIILVFLSVFLIVYIGKPFEYWTLAERDTQIRIAIEAILTGENPYKQTTPYGLTPSPLPFTFLLYLPVYLITGGYTFFMNIIIIIIFSMVIFYRYIDSQRNYLVLPIISVIIFSDWFFLETAMNSDLINSGLFLCLSLLLLPDEIPEQKKMLRFFKIIPKNSKSLDISSIIFSILFGCILAMRMHFWLIGILILLYVLRIYGPKNTLYLTLITLIVFSAIMLPFMFQDFEYFIFDSPIAHNSKFITWRSYDSVPSFGYPFLFFLRNYLNYGSLNSIFISLFIIIFSIILCLINCQNKFHLLLIISICYFIFLFFYLFGIFYTILRDYVSMAAIPFIFSFLFINLDSYSRYLNRNSQLTTH